MIKQLNKNDSILSPFVVVKQWALNNIDPDELVLSEATGSEEPVALEFIDYSSGTPIVNRECNIALEQQSTDLTVPEEGASGSGTFYPETEEVNPKTSTYKRLLYSQVKGAFYNSYRNPTQIFGMDNIDFPLSKINHFLTDEFVMFTIPRDIFGEKIMEKSVALYDNNFDDNLIVQDDGFGNLIASHHLFSKIQEVGSFGNFEGISGSYC